MNKCISLRPLKLLKHPQWLSYFHVQTNRTLSVKGSLQNYWFYFKNDFLCCHILFSIYPGSLRVAACLDTCPSVCLESELKHPSNSPVDEKLSMLVAPHNDGLPRPRHSHSHLSMEIQLFLAPAGAQWFSFSDPKPIWLYPTINVRA